MVWKSVHYNVYTLFFEIIEILNLSKSDYNGRIGLSALDDGEQ